MSTGFYEPTRKDKKRYAGMSVCILTPNADYTAHAKFCQSLASMIAFSWHYGLKIYEMGITERMVVDWARNDLARRAKNNISYLTGKKYTHILWLDNDHVFTPDMACYLAREDLDVVSALYYQRTAPYHPVVYTKDDTDDKYKHYPIIEVPNTLIEVDAVGFGALLMKRDVFDRVPEPWFTIDYKAGEDIAFCVKAKENGVKIHCEGRYKLGHIGPPEIITAGHLAAEQKRNPEVYKDRIRVNFND